MTVDPWWWVIVGVVVGVAAYTIWYAVSHRR